MNHPIPAEARFAQGATHAYCQVRLKWMAAPGYVLVPQSRIYTIDGKRVVLRAYEVTP